MAKQKDLFSFTPATTTKPQHAWECTEMGLEITQAYTARDKGTQI